MRLENSSLGQAFAQAKSGPDGRLNFQIEVDEIDGNAAYQLIFDTASYWRERGQNDPQMIGEVILRFGLPDPAGSYHMPIIITPFSYSTWKSGSV